MPHFAILFNTSFGYARALPVWADTHESRGDNLVFVRDERVVHQVPLRYVAKVEAFETQAAADRFIRDLRERFHGSAVLHVQEMGSSRRVDASGAPSGGGFLAERITVCCENLPRAPGRR